MGFCLSVLKKDYKLYIVIDWFHAVFGTLWWVFGTLWWVFVYFKVFVLVLWECFLYISRCIYCFKCLCVLYISWYFGLLCHTFSMANFVYFMMPLPFRMSLGMFFGYVFVYVFCVINTGIMEYICTWNILSFHFKHQRQCNVVMHTMVKAACHVIPSLYLDEVPPEHLM